MAIKKSKYVVKKNGLEMISCEIKKISERKILNEFPEMKKKLQSLINDFKNISFEDNLGTILNGKVLDKEEIKELIIEATGYTKWEVDHIEKLSSEEIDSIKKQFNVNFKEEAIYRYGYSRKTNSRNNIHMIIIMSIPGFLDVEIHTGRAGYGLEELVNPNEFVKRLKVEAED